MKKLKTMNNFPTCWDAYSSLWNLFNITTDNDMVALLKTFLYA